MSALPLSPTSKRRNLRELFRKDTGGSAGSNNSINSSASSPNPVKAVMEKWNWSSRTINTLSSHSSHEDKSGRREKPPVVFVDQVICVNDAICEDNSERNNALETKLDDLMDPLTEEERKAYYYSKDDLLSFEKDRSLTALMYIKRKENGIPWEENEYSVRGLESLTKKTIAGERSSRELHCAKVLAEQEKERKTGAVSADRLREISRNSSKLDRVIASSRGKDDAVFCGHKIMRNAVKKVFIRSSR